MNYGDLTKAVTALKTIWRDFNTMDADPIDYMFKELGLEEVQAEMMNRGILCYRRRYNDYFIPWHNNKFGPNTVDSVENELLNDAFLECDPEYAELNQEKKSLEKRLAEVNEALEKKQHIISRTKMLDIYGVNTRQVEDKTCIALDRFFNNNTESVADIKAKDEISQDFNRFISKKSIKEQIDSLKVAGEETPCGDFDIPNTPGEWCQDCTKAECKYNRLNPANNKPKSFTDLSAEELTKLALSK